MGRHSAYITPYLYESVDLMARFACDATEKEHLAGIAEAIVSSLRSGGKLLIAGNGGSAGDAQHIAGEFVVRLMYDRARLGAIALTTDGRS